MPVGKFSFNQMIRHMRIPGRPCRELVFGKNGGHMRVARSSKKIPYGVSRAEIRALTSVQGPLNHTPIIPQVEVFVNRQNQQKKID